MALQIDEDWWLEEAGYPDDFINHSCNPNLAFSEDADCFVAIRDIKKGDEVYFDYATSIYQSDWGVDCLCRDKDCRGHITGFEGLNEQKKKEILPFCLPYIRLYGEE